MSMLMLLLTLSLSGCQSKQVIYKDKEVTILPPDAMLIHPCKKSVGFTTPRELAINNRQNLGCIESYEKVIDSLIEWKGKQTQIYTPTNSKGK